LVKSESIDDLNPSYARIWVSSSSELLMRRPVENPDTELIPNLLVAVKRSSGGYSIGYVFFRQGKKTMFAIGKSSDGMAVKTVPDSMLEDNVYVLSREGMRSAQLGARFVVTNAEKNSCRELRYHEGKWL